MIHVCIDGQMSLVRLRAIWGWLTTLLQCLVMSSLKR